MAVSTALDPGGWVRCHDEDGAVLGPWHRLVEAPDDGLAYACGDITVITLLLAMDGPLTVERRSEPPPHDRCTRCG